MINLSEAVVTWWSKLTHLLTGVLLENYPAFVFEYRYQFMDSLYNYILLYSGLCVCVYVYCVYMCVCMCLMCVCVHMVCVCVVCVCSCVMCL